jgi:hypothetical protein
MMQVLHESKRKRQRAVQRVSVLLMLCRRRPGLQLRNKAAVGAAQGGGLTEIEESENLLGEVGRGLEKRHE